MVQRVFRILDPHSTFGARAALGRQGKFAPLGQLRTLLLRLSRHWQNYTTFEHKPQIPRVNNATAQAIGLMEPVLSLPEWCAPRPYQAAIHDQVCTAIW